MKNLPHTQAEIIAALKTSDIGEDLPESVIEKISAITTVFSLDAGDVLTEEGSEGHHAYIILNGSIEVRLSPDPDHPMGSRTLIPGAIIGETGILEAGRRTARTSALEDTQLLCMRDDDLRRIFDEDPRAGYLFMRNLAGVLSRRLRTTNLAIRHSLFIG